MLFNSLIFLGFTIIVLLEHPRLRLLGQNIFLLAASYQAEQKILDTRSLTCFFFLMGQRDCRSLNAGAQENTLRQSASAVEPGMPIVEAVRLFGVTQQALGNWMQFYRSKGNAGLRAHKRDRPAGGRLQG